MKAMNITAAISCVATRLSDENAPIYEFLFDSRRLTLPSQTLFFAIKTAKGDGHCYIPELYDKGVRNFVVTQPLANFSDLEANIFQVEDALQALQQLAVHHRKQFTCSVVGIAGSNGKTIVKEWLAQTLADSYPVVANPNSYNSQIGVAVSVLQMQARHQFAIFEAGISQSGEMEKLEKMIQPQIGILTNIGDAHSQFFENDEQKLEEKLKLFSSSESLIYCADNELISSVLHKDKYAHLEKISWGNSSGARYQIVQQEIVGHHTKVTIQTLSEPLLIPFIDGASVENAMQVAVFLLNMGVQVAAVNEKIGKLSSISMRMEVKEGLNQSVVLNDTYSLDINSLRIALDFLNSQALEREKNLYISDFEQVTLTEEDYRNIAELINSSKISNLVLVGTEISKYVSLFDVEHLHRYTTTAELLQNIHEIDNLNKAILIKGARNFRFEKIVEALQNRCQQTQLQVHLEAIVSNLNFYKSKLQPSTKLVAMVKAMCYGLGDAELVNELAYNHVDYLAVAYTDEGVLLRKRNIRTPIIVLGAEAANFQVMIRYALEPEIFTIYYLRELERVLAQYPQIQGFPIHLKIDTGMHRIGFTEDEVAEAIAIIKANPQLKLASVFSHLAAADDPDEDAFTLHQIEIFDKICKQISEQIEKPFLKHILNSAGIVNYTEYQYDMVRLGLGLYGFSSNPEVQRYLSHSITLKSLITQIKTVSAGDTIGYNRTFVAPQDMRIAVVPLGYADGLPRELSNGVGAMVVNGRHCPIVGKICMDMCMIDITGVSAAIEDEVIVYGESNRVDEIAAKIGKTPYELLTAISKRVQRIYIR